MSINSYAQNFEDVMLWRALGHIERGSYIDIGAQDPVVDSVSRAFHEHHWLGVHVEPTPYYAELLRQQRPGDTVIQAAISSVPAILQFFEIPHTGISTADANIAAQHRERGFDVHEIAVPSVTLSAVFEACTQADIHWLKIDVEGFEEQVLSSWGTAAVRPWIVVIESTLPLTQIETHESWEPILIGYGYSPVYFDGLNRYYVSDTHLELKAAFVSPPNVFDGFTLNGTASATFHKLLEARSQEEVKNILVQSEQQKQSLQHEAERLNANLSSLAETHAEHQHNWQQTEQELSEQNRQAKQEHEMAVQLLDVQQRSIQIKADLAHSYGEQERVLHRQHAVQEQALNQKLQALQGKLDQLQQERTAREQTLLEQTSQAKQEVENLLRNQVQREREVLSQLLAVQQQANREKADLERSHSEKLRELGSQQSQSEKSLTQQLHTYQQDVRNLQKNRIKREQEVAHEKADLAGSHSEQVHALLRQLVDSEKVHSQQLRTQQEEFHHQQCEQTRREQALVKEHTRLLDACAVLEAQVQAEIQSRQQASLLLSQLLAEAQHSLETTHTSLSWRVTAPLRKLAGLFASNTNQTLASINPSETITLGQSMQVATEPQPITVNQVPLEPAMPPLAQATSINMPTTASTLEELLACHDLQFVNCAYRTLLGRAPDPEGLSYYLGRLRRGILKIQILAQLRLSNEGKTYAAKLPGLDTAIQRYQKEQSPLVGWLFRRINGAEGNNPVERKLRGIENQIFLLSNESSRRFNQLEIALTGLHNLMAQQTPSDATAQSNTSLITPSTSNTTPIQPAALDGLKQLSPRARTIYFQLKTAAAVLAGRIA